jgi:exodeoxyribonuclease V alpha subunit
VELYANRLPKAYGYDPVNDIQIICPSRKGEVGTVSLNNALQKLLNPPADDKDEVQAAGRIYRVGDKVMQTKNNYDILWVRDSRTGEGVFNGDIGVIQAVNPAANLCKVRFDDKTALYPFEDVKELEHAYAVTVHKSQGCEFEAVLMPAIGIVPQLCYRNLLYTAVTRAKTRMIVVGSRGLVEQMVDNDKKTRRYSALQFFLTQEDAASPLDK